MTLDSFIEPFTLFPLAWGALGVGAGIGTAVAFAFGRRDTNASPTPLADLEAQRGSLYAQLKELDDTRDKLDAELYEAEREKLLATAATVVRSIDQFVVPAQPAAPTRAERPPGWFDQHPRITSALWGFGAAGLVLGLKAGLDEYSRPRGEGDSMTGGTGGGGGASVDAATGLPPEMAAELAALEARVAANPADLTAANELGHAYIGIGRVMDAWKLAEVVVAASPDDPEARVHQAVTLLNIGDTEMATVLLDKVLEAHPDHAEALGYRGVQAAKDGDREAAVVFFTRGRTADPAQAETFNTLIAQVDRMVAAGAAQRAATAGGPGANLSTEPPEGAPAAPTAPEAPAASGAPEFEGEVTLAAGLPTAGTLYIYVRPEGAKSGPPLRVKKLPATFPAKFSISASDSPMGGSLPAGKVQLSARLDEDGDVMTRTPTEPIALSAPVAAGAKGIVLELKTP